MDTERLTPTTNFLASFLAFGEATKRSFSFSSSLLLSVYPKVLSVSEAIYAANSMPSALQPNPSSLNVIPSSPRHVPSPVHPTHGPTPFRIKVLHSLGLTSLPIFWQLALLTEIMSQNRTQVFYRVMCLRGNEAWSTNFLFINSSWVYLNKRQILCRRITKGCKKTASY